MRLWENRIVQQGRLSPLRAQCKTSLDAKVQLVHDLLNTCQACAACGPVTLGSYPYPLNGGYGYFPYPLLNRSSIPRTPVTKPMVFELLSPASTRKVNARSRGSGATNQILHPGYSLDVASHSESEWGDKGGLRSGGSCLCLVCLLTPNCQYITTLSSGDDL